VVVTFHGHQLVWPEFVRWRRGVTVRSSHILEREVLRRGDVINAQSETIRRFFVNVYGPEIGRKIRVVPNGVDLTKFKLSASVKAACPTSRPTVLFVGTLTRRKGVDILVRAAPKILSRKPETVFQIVGRGPQLVNLIALAERLGVRGSFAFDSQAPDERLSEYYGSAHVVVLPTYAEFFPLVPLEAMAMAKPVVSTKVMGPMDIIQDGKTGILVEPGEPERLAEAIIHLLENDQLTREMGFAGRKLVEKKYDLNVVVAQLEKMYEQMLAERAED
jgi:glycosyltransferase involved in cell wall biosynthesis